MPKAVVLDANVLLPLSLADLLLSLAEKDHFRPLWTDTILAETADAADAIGRGDIWPRIRAMRAAFPEAMIADWQDHAAGIDLPDPDDVHVLAAAIAGRAAAIVTANLKDFPPSAMPPGITVVGPDEFLLQLWHQDSEGVHFVIEGLVARTWRPPITVAAFLATLERVGTPKFVVAAVRADADY